MVVKDSSHRYINLDVNSENIGEVIKATDDPLTFEIAGYTLIPNYAAWDCHYHAYFKVS